MSVYGVETGCGYKYSFVKQANRADRVSDSSNEIITQAESAELSEAEEFEAFKEETWKEIASWPRDSRVSEYIQITDSAFKRMMTDEDFKNRVMKLMKEDADVGRPPIVYSMTWVDENGYRGISYNDYDMGSADFKAHSKHKDCGYVKKASNADINNAWEKSRICRQEQRAYRKKKYAAEMYLKKYFDGKDELESFYGIL